MIRLNDAKYSNGVELMEHVIANGFFQESRIGGTFEMLNARVSVPADFIVYRPGMTRRLGYVEILQLVSGFFDTRHLEIAIPNLQYDYTIQDAYGIRVALQLPKVLQQLKETPGSRRATIHIGVPGDGQETVKPCTQTLNFQIRNGRLNMTIFMRSWDVLSGLPYDVINFNGLNQVFSHLLGVKPGWNTWIAASFHVYRHAVLRLNERFKGWDGRYPYTNFQIQPQGDTLEDYRRWAIDQLIRLEDWEHGTPEGVKNYAERIIID